MPATNAGSRVPGGASPGSIPGTVRGDTRGLERRENGRTVMEPVKTWHDYLDDDAPLTEESVWQAIADANGVDYSEVADGDLAEWL